MADVTLEALSDEGPDVPAAARLRRRRARHRRRACARRGRRRPRGVLGRAGARPSSTGTPTSPPPASGTSRSRSGSPAGLNVTYNCLDRHLADGHGDQVAILWEGEPGDARRSRYAELLAEVGRAANALAGARRRSRRPRRDLHGHGPGAADRDARVRPHRRGALGGLRRLHRRLAPRPHQRRRGEVLITGDGAWRRGGIVPLKEIADDALAETPSIEKCLVLRRTEQDVAMTDGRDVWWHDVVPAAVPDCPPESIDAEHPLFILYTSGTTGKPKGIMHTTGGYLTQVAFTTKYVFDLHPETDVYWCTADCGWVTGHSTSSTARSRTARRASCTRAPPTTRARTASGPSSSSTASRSSTPRRPRSGPS